MAEAIRLSEPSLNVQSAATYLQGLIGAIPADTAQTYGQRCLGTLVLEINKRRGAEEAAPDIGTLAAERTTAILESAAHRKAWEELQVALKPFADLALACREDADGMLLNFKTKPDGSYADIELHHLRSMLVAASLFTPEMLPASFTDGAVETTAEVLQVPAPAGDTTLSTNPADHGIVAADLEGLGEDGPGVEEAGASATAPERDFEGRTAQDRYDDEHGDPLPGLPSP